MSMYLNLVRLESPGFFIVDSVSRASLKAGLKVAPKWLNITTIFSVISSTSLCLFTWSMDKRICVNMSSVIFWI